MDEITLATGTVKRVERIGRKDNSSSYIRSSVELSESSFQMEYGESSFTVKSDLSFDKTYELVLREVSTQAEPNRAFREEDI